MGAFRRLATAVGVVAALAAGTAHAEEYPAKPIRIVVPFSAGGATDVFARALGQKLNDAWKQPVVVENRPGAGGNIGANTVAKAAPDGYTLLMGAIGTNAVNASLYRDMPYDTAKDFQPITQVASVPMVVVVHPSLPVQSIGDLITYAKANPGKINAGHGGIGASQHLGVILFESMTGAKMEPIVYKGSAAILPDLLSGLVQVTFGDPINLLPHVNSGALRAIATTTAKRSASVPDLPTVAEAGVPGYAAAAWYGLFAPAGTPAPIVAKLHGETVKHLKNPEIVARFRELGAEPVGSTPEEFASFIRSEMDRWGKVIHMAGIRAE
jgi:tripartite-type tricarboxylate transporter receptor subunit TctC